jgi:hypothetical protein
MSRGTWQFKILRCGEIIEQMNEVAEAPSEVDALREKAVVQYLLATISEKLAKRSESSVSSRGGLKNGTPHYKDTDWQPEPQSYLCACGCGEEVVWSGIGRKSMFVNDTHRKRYERASDK